MFYEAANSGSFYDFRFGAHRVAEKFCGVTKYSTDAFPHEDVVSLDCKLCPKG